MLDTLKPQGYSVPVVAKSTTRFESRNTIGAQAPPFHTALFLCPCDPLAVRAREPSGSPVCLWAGLSTAYAPPFFCLRARKADYPTLTKGGSL